MDEIGRGTSTYDGLSLAWACARHIAPELRAFTLFATHYFEFTELSDELPEVANVHLDATEHDEDRVPAHGQGGTGQPELRPAGRAESRRAARVIESAPTTSRSSSALIDVEPEAREGIVDRRSARPTSHRRPPEVTALFAALTSSRKPAQPAFAQEVRPTWRRPGTIQHPDVADVKHSVRGCART